MISDVSGVKRTGWNTLPEWVPSQKGWVVLSPQEHQ
jgi:hypothetical protein